MNHDDPNLTAYALGELSPEEAAALAARLREDPVTALEVEEIRALAGRLRGELAGEGPLELSEEQRAALLGDKVLPLRPARRWPWVALALAASVLLAIGGGMLGSGLNARSKRAAIQLAAQAPKVPGLAGTPTQLLAQVEPAPRLALAESPAAAGAASPQMDSPAPKAEPALAQSLPTKEEAAPAPAPAADSVALLAEAASPVSTIAPTGNVRARASARTELPTLPAAPGAGRSAEAVRSDFGALAQEMTKLDKVTGALKAIPSKDLADTFTPEETDRPYHGAVAATDEEYASRPENPFVAVRDQPRSTFSIDVDTAAYTNVRRYLQSGQRPPREAVEIEELLNFFTYDYPAAPADLPCSVNLEAAACPWAPGHRLVRIGLKAHTIAPGKAPPAHLASTIVAKDVKVQVEFNPAQAGAYRLIGYEKRNLRPEDFKDRVPAGVLASGQTVTALYEIVPPGVPIDPVAEPLKYQPATTMASAPAQLEKSAASRELLTLELRWKSPEGEKSSARQFPLVDAGGHWQAASREFRWAAAVASFGLLLRDSAHAGSATWESTRALAGSAQGDDPIGYRQEFLSLIDQAEAVSP